MINQTIDEIFAEIENDLIEIHKEYVTVETLEGETVTIEKSEYETLMEMGMPIY